MDNIDVGRGVSVAAESSPEHRALKARGADVVSQQGRGGITTPEMKFRAFNMIEGQGMSITEPQSAVNPAPLQVEVPIEDMAGKTIAPGLDAVPAPRIVVMPDPVRNTVPETATALPDPIPRPSRSEPEPGDFTGERRVQIAPPALKPSKIATFIGEFSDHDFPCFDIIQENGWVTFVSPMDAPLKLRVNQEIEISLDGKIARYFFTGILVPLRQSNLTVRVFGEIPPQQ